VFVRSEVEVNKNIEIGRKIIIFPGKTIDIFGVSGGHKVGRYIQINEDGFIESSIVEGGIKSCPNFDFEKPEDVVSFTQPILDLNYFKHSKFSDVVRRLIKKTNFKFFPEPSDHDKTIIRSFRPLLPEESSTKVFWAGEMNVATENKNGRCLIVCHN
jgi:hypothetical protein